MKRTCEAIDQRIDKIEDQLQRVKVAVERQPQQIKTLIN